MTDKKLMARSLNWNLLDAWEHAVSSVDAAREKAFADHSAYGFAVAEDGKEETLSYFGTVLTTEEAMEANKDNIGSRALVEEFIKANKSRGYTHFVVTRHGNFGPLSDRTIVYDTKTGSKILWPKQDAQP
ncbi:MAG: hypothetical protein ACXW4B_11435 [Micavibrio sp.]